jgi:folate-binding protein YgfZ
MKMFLPVLLLLPSLVVSFTQHPPFLQRTKLPPISTSVCNGGSDLDYENNPDASPEEILSSLPSGYPPGTPAGLRGEAVRSALESGLCIGWDLSSSSENPLSIGGILQVQGKGMRDFLSNKLTQDFSSNSASYQEACLLDAKGRVVDRLRVAILDSETALILTSPGHSSHDLLQRFDPFIFPLDEITLTNYNSEDDDLDDDNQSSSFVCTLASTQWKDVERVLTEQIFQEQSSSSSSMVPSRSNQCVHFPLDNKQHNNVKVLVVPSTGLPWVSCVGYTLIFYGDGNAKAKAMGSQLWQHLIGDANPEGPIAIGALEYETLRIEAGQPAYGQEFLNKNVKVKTSPLELHWQDAINMDKGCYLGQEGVASIVKNLRGPPRTLYSVVFDDDFNVYESQSSRGDGNNNDNDDVENLTTPPKSGQTLYALGSNEQLSVGTLTSVAEAGGTGDACTVGLALVRRSDSILKQMKDLDLEIPRDFEDLIDVDVDENGSGSGMIQPPPLDPLDGLEVIVGGTFTVGKLKMIPSRRLRPGRNLFYENLVVKMLPGGDDILTSPPASTEEEEEEEEDLEQIKADAEKATVEAEAAAGDAQRKAEKMEMLRKRAEDAMAKRKKKKE